MRFRDIIGQRPLIERLIASAQAGRIAHAQLFSGPEGNQKLALALAYAQFLNCRHKVTAAEAELGGISADSCGKCPSCVKFERLAHPDLHFFFPNNIGELVKKDAQSTDYLTLWREFGLKNRMEFSLNDWIDAMNIGQRQAIINIRDCHTLIEQLALKSCEADYRVVVLWMAEKISDTISSTLLKTLEEPEPQTLFLLVSENPDQISATILSRTQIVQVPALNTEDLCGGLVTHYGLSAAEAQPLAEAAHGNLCRALADWRGHEGEEQHEAYFTRWMRACYKADVPDLLDLSEQLARLGREPLRLFLRFTLEKIRLCLLCHEGCGIMAQLPAEQQAFVRNFSPFITPENAPAYYRIINDAIYFVARNANISNLMTDASLQICRLMAAEKKKKNA